MHPLHDYIAGLVATQVRARHAIVIYDARCELEQFFGEAAGEADATGLRSADFAGVSAKLFTVNGSLLQARAAVEPLTAGDKPQNVVIYAPGRSRGEPKNSLLLEIEKAGARIIHRPFGRTRAPFYASDSMTWRSMGCCSPKP